MKFIAENDNRKVKRTRVAIFRDKHYSSRSARATSHFVVLISKFIKKKNDMFSFEIVPCMQFRSSKGLDKTLTFKISSKRIVTLSSV